MTGDQAHEGALGVPPPAAEEANLRVAACNRRWALLIPAIGVVVVAAIMVIAWDSLPERVGMVSARSREDTLMPKASWPLFSAYGVGFAYTLILLTLVVGRGASPEKRALASVYAVAVASGMTAGGIAMNIGTALHRDPGSGDTTQMAAAAMVSIPAAGITAILLGWWAAHRGVVATPRRRSPNTPRTRFGWGDLRRTAPWRESVWCSFGYRVFLVLSALPILVAPLAMVLRGSSAWLLVLPLLWFGLFVSSGPTWISRMDASGFTVFGSASPLVFHVPVAQIVGAETGYSQSGPSMHSPHEPGMTGDNHINVQVGHTFSILRDDGTRLTVATHDPDAALEAATRLFGLRSESASAGPALAEPALEEKEA